MTPVVVSSMLAISRPSWSFVAGIGVQQRHQIGAVVKGHSRPLTQHGVQMLVVGLIVLTPDGVGRNPLTDNQGGGRIVLGRERVRGAQHDARPAGLEGPHQIGGFGSDVQAGRHAQALERFGAGKLLAHLAQHRHVLVGPVYAFLARSGQAEIFDISLTSSHISSFLCERPGFSWPPA